MSNGRVSSLEAQRELARRRGYLRDPIDFATEKQREFILDPCRFKSADCTRRAGKSYGIAIAMVRQCLLTPRSNVLYLCINRQQAKEIILDAAVIPILKRCGAFPFVDVRVSETGIRFQNGSRIIIRGGDSQKDEGRKFVGSRYKLVVVDEGGLWRNDQDELLMRFIGPGLAEVQGTAMMIGVPGNRENMFSDISTGATTPSGELKYGLWKRFHWSHQDNTTVADGSDGTTVAQAMAQEMADLARANPGIEQTTAFRQEYLGEWCIDSNQLCYPFDEKLYTVSELPFPKDQYAWVLGMDLGFDDATSFVVAGWHPAEKRVVLAHAEEASGLLTDRRKISEGVYDDFDGIKQRVDRIMQSFTVSRMVVDAAAKQFVQEMVSRFGWPLEKAEKGTAKKETSEYVRLLASDMQTGRVVVLKDTSRPLLNQWKKITWDRSDRSNPVPSDGNDHCADAFRYAWTLCKAFMPDEPVKPKEPGNDSKEWMDRHKQRKMMGRNDSYLPWEIGPAASQLDPTFDTEGWSTLK